MHGIPGEGDPTGNESIRNERMTGRPWQVAQELDIDVLANAFQDQIGDQLWIRLFVRIA